MYIFGIYESPSNSNQLLHRYPYNAPVITSCIGYLLPARLPWVEHVSYTHLHCNSLVRTIILHHKVLRFPPIYTAALLPPDFQPGEIPRLPRQLLLQRIDVVNIYMRVAHDMCQTAGDQVGDVRDHVSQQRVAGNVEGHT